ncbi:hypothetical protein SAVIM40S_02238 [Streptomyces avidinii]
MAISAQAPPTTHAITVLEGIGRINASIELALAECRSEVLTIQPGGGRSENALTTAMERGQMLTERGVGMRTLYQHTVRHSHGTLNYAARMAESKVEIRTLEELIERLMIFDRTVAFIPATDDRTVALELRHPGIVEYLAKVFEQFWHRAVPLQEQIPYDSTTDGISGVRHSIAKLLVEGHVDEAIARRLGMNVRTCRSHIAKLSVALGSNSRAQLGYFDCAVRNPGIRALITRSTPSPGRDRARRRTTVTRRPADALYSSGRPPEFRFGAACENSVRWATDPTGSRHATEGPRRPDARRPDARHHRRTRRRRGRPPRGDPGRTHGRAG